jgi:hypothetical protein
VRGASGAAAALSLYSEWHHSRTGTTWSVWDHAFGPAQV